MTSSTLTRRDGAPGPARGAWIGSGSPSAVEIAADQGFDFIIFDSEHGAVQDRELNLLIPLVHGFGLPALVKISAPERAYLQRPLDFGADGVVVPHITSAADAARVGSYAKYPPRGDRSLAAERAARYSGLSDAWIAEQDARTLYLPMVEDAGALAEIEQILALEVVDGVFIGPSDLAIRRGRGNYSRTPEDFADMTTVARACAARDKPWMIPAWADSEQQFAKDNGAAGVVVANEYPALAHGFKSALDTFDAL